MPNPTPATRRIRRNHSRPYLLTTPVRELPYILGRKMTQISSIGYSHRVKPFPRPAYVDPHHIHCDIPRNEQNPLGSQVI